MHRKVLGLAVLLLGVLAFMPAAADGQQKNKQKAVQAAPATDQDYYLIQNQTALTGQVLGFDEANHSVQVRVDFPVWVPNPKFKQNGSAQHQLMNDYNRLMQEQQRLASTTNPRQAQQHYNNMMTLQNRIAGEMARVSNGNGQPPFISKDNLKDFDLQTQDNIVYRKMFLPETYDDTGNLKTYSFEEKAKLRGDNKPKNSYIATASEIHPGQGVWIYLTPPKRVSSSSSSASAAKNTDKDELKTVPHPTVKMLVIFKEGSVAPTTNDNPKKKKN